MAAAKSHLPPPAFSELPLDPSGPPGNAWGRFGKEDALGMLNLLTPDTVSRAAQEIKTGVRVSLDWPLTKPQYPSFKRAGFTHERLNRSTGPDFRVVNDDYVSFNTQGSTQWDGFRHFGNLTHKKYYNNRTHEDISNSSKMGIDAWAEAGGIVGRGVLLDYASWADRNGIDHKPFTPTQVPFKNLLKLVQEQNIEFLPGDILFVRSGFTRAFDALSPSEQKELAERSVSDFAGVENSEEVLKWLWENQFAAVAGDAPAFERSPVIGDHTDERFVLHEWLLGGWGMPIGEMFDLEGLSERCKELGRHSFFVSSVPLKLPGGAASPPNAVAIF